MLLFGLPKRSVRTFIRWIEDDYNVATLCGYLWHLHKSTRRRDKEQDAGNVSGKQLWSQRKRTTEKKCCKIEATEQKVTGLAGEKWDKAKKGWHKDTLKELRMWKEQWNGKLKVLLESWMAGFSWAVTNLHLNYSEWNALAEFQAPLQKEVTL